MHLCSRIHHNTRKGNNIESRQIISARCSLFVELNDGKKKKKTLRSSQDSNLGPPNSNQMLLPTRPPFIGVNSKHFSFWRKAIQIVWDSDGTYRVAAACYYPLCWWQQKVICTYNMQSKNTKPKSLRSERCLWINAVYSPLQCQSSSGSVGKSIWEPRFDSWLDLKVFFRHQCIFVASGEIVHNPIGNLTDYSTLRTCNPTK